MILESAGPQPRRMKSDGYGLVQVSWLAWTGLFSKTFTAQFLWGWLLGLHSVRYALWWGPEATELCDPSTTVNVLKNQRIMNGSLIPSLCIFWRHFAGLVPFSWQKETGAQEGASYRTNCTVFSTGVLRLAWAFYLLWWVGMAPNTFRNSVSVFSTFGIFSDFT